MNKRLQGRHKMKYFVLAVISTAVGLSTYFCIEVKYAQREREVERDFLTSRRTHNTTRINSIAGIIDANCRPQDALGKVTLLEFFKRFIGRPNNTFLRKSTILGYTVSDGNLVATGLLLQRGADANVPQPSGISPLMVAANDGRLDLVQQLLLYHANPNASSVSGHSVLEYAVESGNSDVVQQLIRNGAILNYRDHNGETALMRAVIDKKQSCVRMLLQYGADIGIANQRGKTAIGLAQPNSDIHRMLETKNKD